MAILSIQIMDADDKTKNIPIHLPDSVTAAEAAAFLLAAGVQYEALGGGQITGATFSVDLSLTPLVAVTRQTPLVNTRVEAGATLQFRNSAGIAYSQFIPCFLNGLMAGSQGIVDVDQAPVAAWGDSMVDGVGNATPTDLNGLSLSALVSGKKATRK